MMIYYIEIIGIWNNANANVNRKKYRYFISQSNAISICCQWETTGAIVPFEYPLKKNK
mgnify:CR=1 FL=1